MALADAGCIVDAVCPSGHPIRLTHAVRRMHRYNGLVPVSSFERAIRGTKPDLVVPGDDLATWHLHELYRRESRPSASGNEICGLIERSLGAAANFEVVAARHAFMQVAKEEGIRVPQSTVIGNMSDLHEWIVRVGFPTVLKANGTSGGDGVRVVHSVEEAEQAFHKLQSPPLLARAVKRAVIDRDVTLLQPSLFRRRPVASAQTFVAGHEATTALFCREGNVLASLHFEVIQKVGATGHATVVRRIDHDEMSKAAEKIARRLKLSGFHGLDFMIESQTGSAYLIEINPRTTQVGHLALGEGRSLPAALWQVLTGNRHVADSSITSKDTIALFPQEWKRDPTSLFLATAYHDVPWQEPALVNSCAKKVRGFGNRNVDAPRANFSRKISSAVADIRATPSVGD